MLPLFNTPLRIPLRLSAWEGGVNVALLISAWSMEDTVLLPYHLQPGGWYAGAGIALFRLSPASFGA